MKKENRKINWKWLFLFSSFMFFVMLSGKLSASYEGCAMIFDPNLKGYRLPIIIMTTLLSGIPLWFILRDTIFIKNQRLKGGK